MYAVCDICSDIAADWLSTPIALSQHCTRVLPGLVVIRSELTDRCFAAIPCGGEVFATGSLGKAPLQNFVFNVTPAAIGVWASASDCSAENLYWGEPTTPDAAAEKNSDAEE